MGNCATTDVAACVCHDEGLTSQFFDLLYQGCSPPNVKSISTYNSTFSVNLNLYMPPPGLLLTARPRKQKRPKSLSVSAPRTDTPSLTRNMMDRRLLPLHRRCHHFFRPVHLQPVWSKQPVLFLMGVELPKTRPLTWNLRAVPVPAVLFPAQVQRLHPHPPRPRRPTLLVGSLVLVLGDKWRG